MHYIVVKLAINILAYRGRDVPIRQYRPQNRNEENVEINQRNARQNKAVMSSRQDLGSN